MRKRFYPSDRLPVKAKPNQSLVQVGKTFYLFPHITRRYISGEIVEEKILERLPRIISREYFQRSKEKRKKINYILGDTYVVIPHYPEYSVSEIIEIINKLDDEPTDVIAVEICKHLNI